jgi:hypothetical protein
MLFARKQFHGKYQKVHSGTSSGDYEAFKKNKKSDRTCEK